MKYILGINCSGFHASACLLRDGRVHSAICEERLSRIKQDKSFPHLAIQYCCDAAGITLRDVSHAFVGWHPRHYLRQSDRTLLDAMRARGKISYLSLNELATEMDAELTDVAQTLRSENHELEIRFVDHHQAHLSHAFGMSGFESADFLILDGFGENTTGMCGSVSRDACSVAWRYPWPHSMGSFYSAFTDYLGFKGDSDEWKVMALSALGDPDRYYDAIRSMVHVDGLRFELDLSYFEHFIFFKPHYYSQKLVDLLGAPVAPGQELGSREADIVAAAQRVAEETVFELLANLQRQTGGRRLVVGGGFFMNSVCNGKITRHTPYEAVFVGGSPDDSGIAVGSALQGYASLGNTAVCGDRQRQNYFGREYTASEIRSAVEQRKIHYQVLEDPARTGAGLIREGKILGWFQGASEFGQRALGHRSILADPTRREMKDLVNASVKYRESFRPFAPSVLAERQGEIMELPAGEDAYFMEKVFPIRGAWRERIPAVVHHDGSGRLQTVDRTVEPRFHALITAFESLSGVPAVLNTSFNINGMPMVETPGDAISCFYSCGLDAMILGDLLVEK